MCGECLTTLGNEIIIIVKVKLMFFLYRLERSLFDGGLLDYCMMRADCKPMMSSYVKIFEMVKVVL